MVLKPEELEDKARRLRAGDEKAIEEMLEEEIDRRLFRDRCNIQELAFVPSMHHGTISIANPRKILSDRYWHENLGSFTWFSDDGELWDFFKERLLKKYTNAEWDVKYVPSSYTWVPHVGNNVLYSARFDFSRRNLK